MLTIEKKSGKCDEIVNTFVNCILDNDREGDK